MQNPTSYLARLEQRIGTWARLCEHPTIYILDKLFGDFSEECRQAVWHHITLVHYHIQGLASWLRLLGHLAVEERMRFHGCGTADAIIDGLRNWISVEAATKASRLPPDTLLFIYLAIRDGSLGDFQAPPPRPPVTQTIDDTIDDFY